MHFKQRPGSFCRLLSPALWGLCQEHGYPAVNEDTWPCPEDGSWVAWVTFSSPLLSCSIDATSSNHAPAQGVQLGAGSQRDVSEPQAWLVGWLAGWTDGGLQWPDKTVRLSWKTFAEASGVLQSLILASPIQVGVPLQHYNVLHSNIYFCEVNLTCLHWTRTAMTPLQTALRKASSTTEPKPETESDFNILGISFTLIFCLYTTFLLSPRVINFFIP